MSNRIFALCLVKNEVDIIAECLAAASLWSDSIFVYDNGSKDGTWEMVLDLAKSLSCVVPFKQDSLPFRDSLRGEIFERYRGRSAEGDWWCVLDADEFYIDDPCSFLSEVPFSFDVVWGAMFQYYFTEQDFGRFRADPHAFEDGMPVAQKCRYYLNDWSAPRFFRYHDSLAFRELAWPTPLGPSFPSRIRLKHFQYRSPRQIAKRLATRFGPMTEGLFRHEAVPGWSQRKAFRRPLRSRLGAPYWPSSWRERIVDSRYLLVDEGNGAYSIDHRSLPPVRNMGDIYLK